MLVIAQNCINPRYTFISFPLRRLQGMQVQPDGSKHSAQENPYDGRAAREHEEEGQGEARHERIRPVPGD